MSVVDVTVYHLVMDAKEQFVPSRRVPAGVTLQREADAVAMAAQMYLAVGQPWHWHDRERWTAAQWRAALGPTGEVWTAQRDGQPIGYFELLRRDGTMEIRYFGLVPSAIGQGVGGWLLSKAVEYGWRTGVNQIRLNTCTLDAKAALPNYLARGFRVEREEKRLRKLPDVAG